MSLVETSPGCSPADHAGLPARQLPVSERALERTSRFLKAIGDVPRLRLVALLAEGEACVSELARAERESVSTISQRLRVLRAENIVRGRRRGKHIRCALSDQHVLDLVANALAHAGEAPSQQAQGEDPEEGTETR